MRSGMRSSLLAALLAVAGCTGGMMAPGSVEEDIIGGIADSADPAVVISYMTIPGQQGGAI